MASDFLPDAECLRKLLHYDAETGELIWLFRPRDMFPSTNRGGWAFRVWNARFAEEPALTASGSDGYRRGSLFDKNVLAHRVIWKMVTGEEPSHIDHLNGNTSDNRWRNLRATDAHGSMHNLGRSKLNSSGHIGVTYSKRRQRWIAYIGFKPQIWLGSFMTKEEAIYARERANREFAYHPNHGRRDAREWSSKQ